MEGDESPVFYRDKIVDRMVNIFTNSGRKSMFIL